jgi:hypothetical protein
LLGFFLIYFSFGTTSLESLQSLVDNTGDSIFFFWNDFYFGRIFF